MSTRAEMLVRFEDAKANNAIEGLVLTGDEETLFKFFIEHGITDDAEKLSLFRQFDAGTFQPT